MIRITKTVREFSIVLAGCAFLIAPWESSSQGYPNRSIRLIVPYAAGGPSDATARIVAQKLSEQLGQQVVVDNRLGANSIIGTELGAKAPPDGYTLVTASNAFTINPSVYKTLPYDTLKDFAPISLTTSGALLLAVHPAIPSNGMRGLIALAKSRPGELTCASGGSGSSAHLALELLNYTTGTRITHVPYKGASQGVTDLLGGHVSMYFTSINVLLPYVRSGKLKGLAVTTQRRSTAAPGIPTVAESGVPGYEVLNWNGILAPAGTPREIISRLNAEIAGQLKAPDVQEKFAANGMEVAANTPEQFGSYIASEIAKWGKVVKAAGIKAD